MSSSRPIAAVIIPTFDGGIVLIARESKSSGELSLVSGPIDGSSSAEDVVVEEALAETGLSIAIDRFLWVVSAPEAEFHIYLAKSVDAASLEGVSSVVPVVFDLSELPMDRIVPPTYRQAIQHWMDGDDIPQGSPPPPIPGGPPGEPADPDTPPNADDPGNNDDPGDLDAPGDPTAPPAPPPAPPGSPPPTSPTTPPPLPDLP